MEINVMWTYKKDGESVFTIPISNIDYALISNGIKSNRTWMGQFFHPKINKYSNVEFITVLYKKSGGFIDFDGVEAFNQISLLQVISLL